MDMCYFSGRSLHSIRNKLSSFHEGPKTCLHCSLVLGGPLHSQTHIKVGHGWHEGLPKDNAEFWVREAGRSTTWAEGAQIFICMNYIGPLFLLLFGEHMAEPTHTT